MIIATFLACLAAFVAIGLASARKARPSKADYYLASSDVKPMMAGLSAVATNNSGYMFIGVIGFTYATGLAAIWLMVGWIVGDFLASLFVHRKLREMTEATGQVSFAAVLAKWSGQEFATWRRIAAVISIAFLGAYASAQIAAGSKALEGVLGWTPWAGAVISAGLILAYSIFGGIRASIWTDVAQSMVMVVAMIILLAVAIAAQGGVGASLSQMQAIPGFLSLSPGETLVPGPIGLGLFILGWMFAGLSVIGQPHIMVRFMALDRPSDIVATRVWYYAYFTAFYALATGVGLMSRLYFAELPDAELALPTLATQLLPGALVGLILAGIFAATMSTADSLVLSCSAALTNDLGPKPFTRPLFFKAATALVTLGALGLALSGPQSVFELVILAWSALACAFGPLLIIQALGRRMNEWAAIAIMVIGVGVSLYWRYVLGWQGLVYEGLPGITVASAIGFALSQKQSADALVSEQAGEPEAP
jgi:sodium/proline symporter